jgi:hypothetical protein
LPLTNDTHGSADEAFKKFANLLIISGFCEFAVDNKFELRSGVADITGRSGLSPTRPSSFPLAEPLPSPSESLVQCGIRTPNQKVVRHPKGLFYPSSCGSRQFYLPSILFLNNNLIKPAFQPSKFLLVVIIIEPVSYLILMISKKSSIPLWGNLLNIEGSILYRIFNN